MCIKYDFEAVVTGTLQKFAEVPSAVSTQLK
jgi:hypothetical protein